MRVEDLTKFEGECPIIVVFSTYMDIRIPVVAVDEITGPKEYSREQAFNIIREWAKEFTEKYGNCDFDGSYYDAIDEFIDKKLGTI